MFARHLIVYDNGNELNLNTWAATRFKYMFNVLFLIISLTSLTTFWPIFITVAKMWCNSIMNYKRHKQRKMMEPQSLWKNIWSHYGITAPMITLNYMDINTQSTTEQMDQPIIPEEIKDTVLNDDCSAANC